MNAEPEWMDEFEQTSGGLVCKRCHASVPQLGAHPGAHVEWCRRVEQAVRRTVGG